MPTTNTHCKWLLGNQVFYATHRARWVDVVGQSVNSFVVERAAPMVGAAAVDTYWGTGTVVETSANATNIVAPNTAGAFGLITTDNQDYDGLNLQASGAAFTIAANKPFYFGAKLALNHATSTDIYIGLCTTRTIILAAAGAHALHASTKSHVGFLKLDGGTATKYIAEKAGAVTSSSAATMDTSAHIYEIEFDGSSLDYYVDGSQVGTIAIASAPTAALRPSLCFRTGSNNARTCTLYWWKAFQIGY